MRLPLVVCLGLSLLVGSSFLGRKIDLFSSEPSFIAEASPDEYIVPDPFSPSEANSTALRLSEEEVAAAEAFWRRQILRDSTDGRAYYYVANALLTKGEHLAAESAYRKAITYAPTNVIAHKNLALILVFLGEAQDERLTLLRESARLAPDNVDVLSVFASQLQAQGYYDEAADVFTQALQLDADNPQLHLALGRSLQAQAKYEEAAMAYRSATRLAPKDNVARREFAEVLYRQGQVEAAISIDRRVNYYIADEYRIYEQHSAAEINYREAVRLNPDFTEAYIKLASTLHKLDRTDEAETFYKRAIEMVEDNPRSGGPFLQYLYDSYSSLLKEQGLDAEATAIQERSHSH